LNVCVLVPAFNVASAIAPLVRAVRSAGLPVCVVDDGSSDGSGALAAEAGAHVITHVLNQGKGRSLIDGFRYLIDQGYEAVITLDGDGQHDPADLPRFLQAAELGRADLVVGNRMGETARMPLVRRLTNRLMSALLSNLCGVRIPDSQCGYRLIRCRWLHRIELSSSGYDMESEMLMRAAWSRAAITSVPIRTIYQHQTSHIRPVRDTIRFVRLLVRMQRLRRQLHGDGLDRSG